MGKISLESSPFFVFLVFFLLYLLYPSLLNRLMFSNRDVPRHKEILLLGEGIWGVLLQAELITVQSYVSRLNTF